MQTTELAQPHTANGNTTNGIIQPAAAPRGHVMPAIVTDEHRNILKAMVDRNATNAQVEMLIVVGNRYDLDPLMGHVVLINGKCFVTHKGLMHKAHASGVFDGIDTQYGRDDLGEYCECSVFRKDMSRPFTGRIYTDEYRAAGPVWKTYPRAMAAKTAESFVLRRAFDVSLTSQEELGVADAPPPAPVYSDDERQERLKLGSQIAAASKALNAEQFNAFKTKTAEMGGVKNMETGELRQLLDQVTQIVEANTQREQMKLEQAQPQAEAQKATITAEAEDDPFDDSVPGEGAS